MPTNVYSIHLTLVKIFFNLLLFIMGFFTCALLLLGGGLLLSSFGFILVYLIFETTYFFNPIILPLRFRGLWRYFLGYPLPEEGTEHRGCRRWEAFYVNLEING